MNIKLQDSFELHNRGCSKVLLTKVAKNKYLLKSDLDFIRCIFSKDNSTIVAVDPPGGPFLQVGDAITDSIKIESIEHSLKHQGFVLTLKYRPCR